MFGQTIWQGMTGRRVNNKLEKMEKEEAMV